MVLSDLTIKKQTWFAFMGRIGNVTDLEEAPRAWMKTSGVFDTTHVAGNVFSRD